MKILNSTILLTWCVILGVCGPFITHAETESNLFAQYPPGWQITDDHLSLLTSAFQLQHEVQEYAFCSSENPYYQGTSQFVQWHFALEGRRYTLFIEQGTLGTVSSDVNFSFHMLSYTIRDAETGEFILKALRTCQGDGAESQFLIWGQEHSVKVLGTRGDEPIVQTFSLSGYPYGLSPHMLTDVAASATLEWVEFEPATLTLETKKARAHRDDASVHIQFLNDMDIQMTFYPASQRYAHVTTFGIAWNPCEVPHRPIQSCDVLVQPDQQQVKHLITQQAHEMFHAFSQKDYTRFMTFIPRDLVDGMGGEEQFLDMLSQDPLEGKGTIKERKIIHVSDFVLEEDVFAAFVTVHTEYDFGGEGYLQQTYMIAVSDASGAAPWKFYSSQGKTIQEEAYATKFPRLTARFPFPECFFQRMF